MLLWSLWGLFLICLFCFYWNTTSSELDIEFLLPLRYFSEFLFTLILSLSSSSPSPFPPSLAMFIHINLLASILSSSQVDLNIIQWYLTIYTFFMLLDSYSILVLCKYVETIFDLQYLSKELFFFSWNSRSLLGNKNCMLKTFWGNLY